MVESHGLFIFEAVLLTSVLWIPLLAMSLLSQRMMAIIGRKAVLIIGLIGIPIHEASHMLACLIFNYKIVDMSLYKPCRDGTLGFVSYQYKPSLIAPFACLIIGIAPLIGGWISFLSLTYGLRPDLYYVIIDNIGAIGTVSNAQTFFLSFVSDIFNGPVLKTVAWAISSFSILLFCVPSKADFYGCKKGILYLFSLLVVWTLIDADKAINCVNSLSPVLTVIAAPMYIGILMLVVLYLIFRSKQIMSQKLVDN